jgi:uncharacterized glyoxalase superfamily protein PhnB
MDDNSYPPVLMVEQVRETAGFYTRHFGFEPTLATEWCIKLCHRDRPDYELAFLSSRHPGIPAGYGTDACGVVLSIEVADARAEYARLIKVGGLEAVLALRDEPFGQRHFMVCDPAGTLVDVIQHIPLDAGFGAGSFESGYAAR